MAEIGIRRKLIMVDRTRDISARQKLFISLEVLLTYMISLVSRFLVILRDTDFKGLPEVRQPFGIHVRGTNLAGIDYALFQQTGHNDFRHVPRPDD